MRRVKMQICWWLLFVWTILQDLHQVQSESFRFRRTLDHETSQWVRNNASNYHNNNSNDRQPELQCCACDEAKYELVFEALWSKHTHPDEYPENGWLAKFGDIIGASHSSEFKMWQQDSYASDGVKELAETGATKKLEAELKQVSSKTRTIIKARELHHPTLNSKTSAVFRTDRLHHLVSILSKLSPSPDWMVGVSGLELCQPDCSWAQQRTVDLYPWDAGTDSGDSFGAPDSPTRPPEKIRPFKVSGSKRLVQGNAGTGDQQDSQTSATSKPFARLTITRQRIYEKSCSEDSTKPLKPPVHGASNDWPSSEPSFPQHQQASYADCRLSDWSEWSTCSSRCGKGVRTRARAFVDDRATQFGCSRADLIDKEVCISECQGSNVCVTLDWSEWSECSVSCGKGLRKRTRAPVNPLKKGCEDVELAELEPCTGMQGVNCTSEPTTCEVTEWSHWSECSVACGKGTRIRTRQYLKRQSMENCNVKLLQKQPCQGRPELCKHSTKAVPARHRQQQLQIINPDLPVIDCKLSAWSPWSTCSALCGNGKQTRSRYIIQMPQNGGKPCDTKLSRTIRCKNLPPCSPLQNHDKRVGGANKHHYQHLSLTTTTQTALSMNDEEDDTLADHGGPPENSESLCEYGEWSDWSECEVVCRPVKKGAQKIRHRFPINKQQQDRGECPIKKEYYYCDPEVYC